MRNLTTGARLAACACVLLLLAADAVHAKAWRGVVPLRTTRAQVERRLGKPNRRSRHYEFPAERAFITYSAADGCAAPGAGWDVPRNTVVSVVVTPKKTLRLPSLGLDMRKFRKTPDRETPAHALYTDEQAGVTYRVFDDGGEYQDTVLSISFYPAASEDHRRCPETK